MKNRITERDYIKAHRKASREEEIAAHGCPVPKSRVHHSEKTYNRKKGKAAFKKQPFPFLNAAPSLSPRCTQPCDLQTP
ncbi:MAG: hypothetical protein LBU80_01230 [Rikenellaceae bacterium]|jgi:hypothetical protein|nr:hypothetical protein [Rikenellaceae bacterium]